ncbi:MAG: hypothetical protein F6K41_18470 [Symploca sp. SIO3E6]|nr:hypothetical protein [Caldora sp. SIO3E6]
MIIKRLRKFVCSSNPPKRYLLLPIFFLFTGCGSNPNLAKIREFAMYANEANQQLPLIAGDFYPSCLRAARYFAVDILPSDDSSVILSTVTAVELEALSQQINDLEIALEENPALSSQVEQLQQLEESLKRRLENPPSESIAEPNFLQARVDAQKACNETQQFAGEATEQIPSQYLGSLMEMGNGVIVNYLLKLGELAGADLIDFDTQFDILIGNSRNLTNQLTNLFEVPPGDRGLIKERVTAGLELANFIVDQIFEGQRRETLKEAITLGNQPLKNYAEGLQSVVQRVYIEQYLRTEESFLDQYYIEYISAVLDSNERKQGNSVLSMAELLIAIDNDRWNPAKDQIQEQRNLGLEYIKLLQTIIDGHQELADIYSNGEEPSSQAVEKLFDESSLALKEFIEKAKSVEKARKDFPN